MRIPAVAIALLLGVSCQSRREPPPAVLPAPDAGPPRPPSLREVKVAAYRDFLAEVDGTLHALRLERQPKHATFLSWDWPIWLAPALLDERLDALATLARTGPAIPELDDAAVAYVEVVRAEVPVWSAAIAAWKEGEAPYTAAIATTHESFERFGASSQALRAAMPPEPLFQPGTWPYVEQACLAGIPEMAVAATAEPVDVPELEAGTPPRTVYRQIPRGHLRTIGLRCSRAALDLLEHSDETDRAQDAVRMGLMLVSEDTRRATLRGAYITAFGTYAQLAAYAVRRP